MGLFVLSLCLTAVASLLSVLLAVYLDGWPMAQPLNTEAIWTVGADRPWLYRPIALIVPALWFGLLLPLSYTSWWRKEAAAWEQVVMAIIAGDAGCSCESCDPEHRVSWSTSLRYGLIFAVLSAMTIGAELMRLHALGGLPSSGALRAGTVLQSVSGFALLGIALGTTVWWRRPRFRVWVMRAAICLFMASALVIIGEHDEVARMLMRSPNTTAYREAVLSVWLSAASVLSFMFVGWAFAERALPSPESMTRGDAAR